MLLLAAGVLPAAARPASAAGPDIAAGQAYAAHNCARCHAVGRTGASPVAGVPPFRAFARLWPLESLEEALAEGIMVGHPAMPEFAPLSPAQIRDFIGYLGSIQRR